MTAALETKNHMSPKSNMPAWKQLLESARPVLFSGRDPAAVLLTSEALEAFRSSGRKAANRPELGVLAALAKWRRTGQLETNYRNLTEARLQMWELEYHCPVFAFQKLFLQQVANDYPDARGPRQFSAVCNHIAPPISDRIDLLDQDVLVHRTPGANLTIVGFGGMRGNVSGMGWTMFDRAVSQPLNANLIRLRDRNLRYFLAGVKSLGDLEASLDALRDLLAEFSGTRIVVTGGSAGVFGALLYASRLGVEHAVVSSGLTSLDSGVDSGERQRADAVKLEAEQGLLPYPDLPAEVAASSLKRVDFFVAGKHEFDFSQMQHLKDRTNVVVPHVYENEAEHSILAPAILDGAFGAAIRDPF